MQLDIQKIVQQRKDGSALLQRNALVLHRVASGEFAPEAAIAAMRLMVAELKLMEDKANTSLALLRLTLDDLSAEFAVAKSVLQAAMLKQEVVQIESEESAVEVNVKSEKIFLDIC